MYRNEGKPYSKGAHGRKVIECGAKRENGHKASIAARAGYTAAAWHNLYRRSEGFSFPYGGATNSWIRCLIQSMTHSAPMRGLPG